MNILMELLSDSDLRYYSFQILPASSSIFVGTLGLVRWEPRWLSAAG